MAKPIRTKAVELEPRLNLSPEELKDYEYLEEHLDKLTPRDKRYYEMLQGTAYLHHVLEVMLMDNGICGT